jgi:hypothetical protein
VTKFVNRRGFLVIQPDSEYPKYFGYHPNFRGISEPIRIQTSYTLIGRLKIFLELIKRSGIISTKRSKYAKRDCIRKD